MKKSLPVPIAIVVVVLVMGLAATFLWKTVNPPPSGPDPAEVLKHSGPDSIRRAMEQGPPPGPPEPGGGRRPSEFRGANSSRG